MRTYLTALVLAATLAPPAPAQAPPARELLERYQVGLAVNPDNAFYQYAVAQTARRAGVDPPPTRGAQRADRWRGQLYETTTGALAVQESLQLDRLAGGGDTPGPSTVPIESVRGIATPSIPFDRLAGGRAPVVEPLARAVPADWYYAHFPRVTSMRRVLAAAERWGGHLLAAYSISARDARVREKLERQLLLRATPELDAFYDLVVGDVAVAGSDPFVAEGSDVTVLFTVRNAMLFNARLDLERSNAVAATGQRVSILREPYRSWTVVGVSTPDRSLSSFTTVRGDLAIVSSSLEALRRVADTVDGIAPSMAASDDFKYMRIAKPYADSAEDGFLFLSDAFVRRVTSPRLKIGEARRVRCAVSLQTAAFAALMFAGERAGRTAGTIDDLVAARTLDPTSLRCPDGGRYSLDAGVPVCSVHNRLRFLTPNLELRLDRVTPEEAAAYDAFREGYALYWRRFVDPVGVRVRAAERLEIEAIVLPLVENSIYSEIVGDLGPEPVSLSRPQLRSAVSTFEMKLPSAGAGFGSDVDRMLGVDQKMLFGRALGDHVSVQIADAEPVLALDMAGAFGGAAGMGLDEWLLFSPLLATLALPTAVVVPVRDRAALDEALGQFRGRLLGESTGGDGWFRVDNYQLVQGGARTIEAVTIRFLVLQWRVFYAVTGDWLVIATDRALVEELAGAEASGGESGHLRFELAPARWSRIGPAVALAYAEDARRACLGNVGWLDALRAAYPKAPHELDPEALALLGATFVCPDGGRYVAGANGVSCALHGTRLEPRQGPRPQPGSPAAYVLEGVRRVEATLTLTGDGLESRIRIE
jgi:hypothetical protein